MFPRIARSYLTNYLLAERKRPSNEFPRSVWPFTQFEPTDLPDYLDMMALYFVETPLITVRLKNEHPKVTAISIEPWGTGDSFPFGANYFLVMSIAQDRLPEEE